LSDEREEGCDDGPVEGEAEEPLEGWSTGVEFVEHVLRDGSERRRKEEDRGQNERTDEGASTRREEIVKKRAHLDYDLSLDDLEGKGSIELDEDATELVEGC